ncbi:acyltransferase domain-containing protein [uncultured Roseibium sp.]|uniref:acyltransferase domain-containing protein n=1 Tax=uncultured Roseibium sp. TaxID=1936171 RepID=UPI00321653E5
MALDSDYWWRNVRQPVKFADAISRMSEDGFGVLVEIGPKAVLGTYMNDVLRSDGKKATVLPSLEQPGKNTAPVQNPIAKVAGGVVAHGGKVDLSRFVAPRPTALVKLPRIPLAEFALHARPDVGTGGLHVRPDMAPARLSPASGRGGVVQPCGRRRHSVAGGPQGGGIGRFPPPPATRKWCSGPP